MINAKYVDGLELRIRELNKKLSNEADEALHLIAENNSLKAERDALAAQVEVLRDALQCLFNDIGGGKKFCGHDFNCVCAGDKARAALATVPQQHLAEIRAQAGLDGFFKGVAWILDIDVKDISAMVAEEAAKQYAENIRQGGAK